MKTVCLLNSLILIFATSFAQARLNCPDDGPKGPGYYHGKPIVFNMKPKIDPQTVCIGANARVVSDCKNIGIDEENWECTKGMVATCRFCRPDDKDIVGQADFARLFKKETYKQALEKCMSLESTKKHEIKVFHTRTKFMEIKDGTTGRLEDIKDLINEIILENPTQNEDGPVQISESQAAERSRKVERLSALVTGPGNPASVLAELGTSDTTNEYVGKLNRWQSKLPEITGMILGAQLNGLLNRQVGELQLYDEEGQSLSDAIDLEFNYVPQESCEYK